MFWFVLAFVGWAIESSAVMEACIERFVSCIDGDRDIIWGCEMRYPIIWIEFGGKQKCRIPRDGRKVIGIILHFNYSIQNMAYHWGYSLSLTLHFLGDGGEFPSVR